jgi:hypothetical protein
MRGELVIVGPPYGCTGAAVTGGGDDVGANIGRLQRREPLRDVEHGG